MTIRKRGTDIVTPPHGVTVPEDHDEVQPALINFTYHRTLWIVAEKHVQPGADDWRKEWSCVWVWADRDGNVKETYTGTEYDMPAHFKKHLEA
jgi:hypothetical protein